MIVLNRIAFLLLLFVLHADGVPVKGQRTRALKRKKHGSMSGKGGKGGKGKGGGSGSRSGGGGGGSDDDNGGTGYEVTLRVTNLTYLQPFSGFVVLLHSREADPLFVLGQEASEELRVLAEDGNPGPLFNKYDGGFGVGYAAVHDLDAPFFGGEVTYIKVPYDRAYPYITIASMAINTNDCFVALNGVYLSPGQVLEAPGYDAGTEVNNELCR